MDPSRTGLLLIEFQNDFTTEGGVQHAAVQAVMSQTGMLANSRDATRQARARGVTIMHAPIGFAGGYPEIAKAPYGILAGIVESGAFRQGSWGAEICNEMAPQEGDVVIEGKRGLDCFASTNLDFILRQRGIETLALAGFLTNCCVESTMRSAYERGYRVVTLTDCMATVSAEAQQASIENNFPMFSMPLTHPAFLEQLGRSPSST